MKPSVFILIVLSMSLFSCQEKPKDKKASIPKVEKRALDGLVIAYYVNDSIKTKFQYYKEQDALVTKKQKVFQAELQRRTKELENYVQRNDEKARSGLLSQNEIAQIQQKAQQMEQSLMQYQQVQGAKIEEETMTKLEAISKKIEVLGKQYCEKHNIDILLIHGEGGQLNYINSSMDITEEFIIFLNENQSKIEKDLN